MKDDFTNEQLLAEQMKNFVIENMLGGFLKSGSVFDIKESCEYAKKKYNYIKNETPLTFAKQVNFFTIRDDKGVITTNQGIITSEIRDYIQSSIPYRLLVQFRDELRSGIFFNGIKNGMLSNPTKDIFLQNQKLNKLKNDELQAETITRFLEEIQIQAVTLAAFQSSRARYHEAIKTPSTGLGQPIEKSMGALVSSLAFKFEEAKVKKITNNSYTNARKTQYILFFECLREFFIIKEAGNNLIRRCYCKYF